MIDLAAAADAFFVQIGPESGRGERANRQVHPEDPGPGKILDDEAASQRSEDRRQGPDAGQPALNLRSLVHRVEVADDGHSGWLNSARADALHQAKDDQRRHRPGESAQDRAKEEDRNPGQHNHLATGEIGQLAEHHRGRGLSQQERREYPAVKRQAAELADDLRHGGGDDGRFDRDHEIRGHYGGEHKRPVSRERGHGVFLGGCPSL